MSKQATTFTLRLGQATFNPESKAALGVPVVVVELDKACHRAGSDEVDGTHGEEAFGVDCVACSDSVAKGEPIVG